MTDLRAAPKVWLTVGLSVGLTVAGLSTLFWTWSRPPSEKFLGPPSLAGDPTSFQRGLATRLEALSIIRERANFPLAPVSDKELADLDLRRYLERQDAYSDYLSAAESARMQDMQSDHYLGMGMEIERSHDGRIIGFPYPASPAERAGMRNGDILEAVNGVPVTGLSLAEIGIMSAGVKGTTVSLEITRNGQRQRLEAEVGLTDIPDLTVTEAGQFTVLSIRAFTQKTPIALRDRLNQFGSHPIVIDLRMNRGGDFHAAVDSAKLFLPGGDVVVSTQGTEASRDYRANQDGPYVKVKVFVWQDRYTASAAELFIAALVENHRARSIGQTSYGKGTKQDIIPLTDGSTLILTTATLLTPLGANYNHLGLTPDYALPDATVSFDDYLTMTAQAASSSVAERNR